MEILLWIFAFLCVVAGAFSLWNYFKTRNAIKSARRDTIELARRTAEVMRDISLLVLAAKKRRRRGSRKNARYIRRGGSRRFVGCRKGK